MELLATRHDFTWPRQPRLFQPHCRTHAAFWLWRWADAARSGTVWLGISLFTLAAAPSLGDSGGVGNGRSAHYLSAQHHHRPHGWRRQHRPVCPAAAAHRLYSLPGNGRHAVAQYPLCCPGAGLHQLPPVLQRFGDAAAGLVRPFAAGPFPVCGGLARTAHRNQLAQGNGRWRHHFCAFKQLLFAHARRVRCVGWVGRDVVPTVWRHAHARSTTCLWALRASAGAAGANWPGLGHRAQPAAGAVCRLLV